jgi:uncharacterized coiled-coil protein SlyX
LVVITIHTAMLVALGFLVAALLVLLLAPFYRNRAARLATEELRRSLPLSESEIRADKDRLRADFAVHIHELEQRAERDALAAARQRIELNRRDAAISGLEGEVARMRTSLDEHENARRVLEQTITDRLPKVEQRLAEAKRMLAQRDREIAQLSESASSHARALEEATQINTQQRDELHRLNAALTTRAARNREGLGDPRFDGEVALRSEIEALRTKTREQAALVSRLQGLLVRQGGAVGEAATEGRAAASGGNGLAGASVRAEEEIKRLRSDLAEAEDALRAVKSSAEAGKAGHEALDREARTLKAANQDQAAEIARLKAALAAYEGADKDDKAIKDSKISMKARLSALEAETSSQASTIQTLRAEVAAANERLARQAAHFRDEMRRLGAGTLPASAQARRPSVEPMRKPLSERIAEPRLVAVPKLVADEPAAAEDGKRVSGFLKALEGGAEEAAGAGSKNGTEPAPAEPAAAVAGEPKPRRRGGLIDRITGLDKTSA